MKKVILATIIVASLLSGKDSRAQQLPQFTQYMFNPYIINPAVGGTHNYYQIRYNNRFQWVGLTDAPQTYSLSAYGPHGSKDMGFGGNFYHDITGPTTRTSGLFSYSYNMQITSDGMRMSGGLSLGFLMFRADGSKFEFGDNFDLLDPALYTNTKSVFTPDASMGVYFYSTTYFFGLAAHQLFGQRLYRSDLTRINEDGEEVNFYGVNRLRQHFMLSGGMIIPLNRDFEIEPTALVKYMYTGPIQVDINGKITYRNEFWGGLSLRWQDGVSILMGYNLDGKYMFGYCFDYTFTGIGRYQVGTHEIMIGVMFDKIK